jgi:hypothetical protein
MLHVLSTLLIVADEIRKEFRRIAEIRVLLL